MTGSLIIVMLQSEKRINELLMKMNLEEGVDNESDRPDLALFLFPQSRRQECTKVRSCRIKAFQRRREI